MKHKRKTKSYLALALLIVSVLGLVWASQVAGMSVAKLGSEAPPSPSSPTGWEVYVNKEWGYSIRYPRGWEAQVTFTNSSDSPTYVIRQRITFSGPKSAEIMIDVWEREPSVDLMEWIDKNQRRFLELGRVNIPSSPNAIIAGQEAMIVSQRADHTFPTLFLAYVSAEDRTFLVQYAAFDGGNALEIYRSMLISFETTPAPSIVGAGTIPELVYPTLWCDVWTCEGECVCCAAPREEGCCDYPQIPHWQCSEDAATRTEHKGNCTYWAAYMRRDVGDAITGNAGQWAVNAESAGFPVDTNPRAGDIMVDEGIGHVAYVTGVSEGTVYVTEMNWCTSCPEQPASYPSSGKKFIHRKDAPPPCPPENCTPGNEVGRDFFVEVLERLADVPVSDFAVDALVIWEPYENTLACWNPLATTWYMEGSCNFNSAGVKHYLNQDMGTQATANTLAQGYYDNIRRMLRFEEFNREGLRVDLSVWGTCSGLGCNSLLNEWEALWIAHGGPSHADLKQCSDLTISPSNPQVDETVTFCFDVCNDGDQSVTFQNIGPQGHGPPDGQGGLWNEFAHNITVGAGQRVTVCPSRSFEWEGTWCIEHIPTQDQDGNWQDLPANGYRQAQCFGVGSVAPTPGDGATLYENENYGGQSETFTSDDGNLGDNAIRHDRATSVRVRGTYFTTLYEHPDYAGTAESFHYDDPNLSDNHIGNDTVSSLRVYPAVALYEHSNFGGKCETFVSDQANLSGTYIAQDTVSSIKVPSCYEVTLYEHPNYEGRSELFTDDDSNLTNNHIGNDVVSSIKVERIVPDGITLFEHENFVGRNRTFTSDNSNLPSEYVDMASSIKIRGPFMATVYEHPSYGGTGETFDYDDPDLRNNHISNDTISSMRVWPAAALYEHSNYRGKCQTFDRDDSNLSGTYIDSDTASSLKVPIGYLVTLCEHPNFEGTCQTFTSNNSNLSSTNVGNDTVSSITVAAAEDYDAENGGTSADFWVDPGESFDVTISVRNNGDAIWRRIHQVRLGLLTWNDTMGVSDLRRDLDSGESVASGATRSWTVSLTVPTTPGTYWQAWQMLREDGHVGWFGDLIRFEVHIRNPGVTLYEDANYTGESEFFDSDDPDLSNNTIGEDTTTSIWIEGDYWAILFRDRSFRGNYEIFDSSDSDLANNFSIGNNSASSIMVGQGDSPSWALFGDFNWDCDVNVADIMQVANRWRCKCEDTCYNPLYDLDSDCDIDIVDIMLVVKHWGESC